MKRTLLTGLATVALSASLAGVANAAPEAQVTPQAGCGAPTTTYSNVQSQPSETKSPSGSDWQVQGSNGVTISLSKSVSIQNSFTGSVAPSVASVGFSVSKTTDTTESGSFQVPSGQTWVLRADQVFRVKSFHWVRSGCLGNQSGDGKAYDFTALRYRTYRI